MPLVIAASSNVKQQIKTNGEYFPRKDSLHNEEDSLHDEETI